MGTSSAAVLDPEILERLREEIGDDLACADFIEIFLDLLPGRLKDLSTSMDSGEQPWEPALNLAATCRMLGALALAEHLEGVQEGATLLASPECVRAHLLRTFGMVRQLRAELHRHLRWLRSSGIYSRHIG